MNALSIQALEPMSRWVAWQTEDRTDGKPTKVPYAPTGQKARANGPTTWGTREQAAARAVLLPKPYGTGGVGLELGDLGDSQSAGGIDLDACCKPGEPLALWAAEVVERIASYTEISPSETGAKVFFTYDTEDLDRLRRMALIETTGFGRQFKCPGNDHPPAIELHLGNRYFAVTDKRMPDSPVEFRQVELEDLVWLLKEAGPAFAQKASAGSSSSSKSSRGNDKSRSALAFKKAAEAHAAGKTFNEMVALLTQDPDTTDWVREKGLANNQRELRRLWYKVSSVQPDEGLITEGNVAGVFAETYRLQLRYCHTTGSWFEWTSTHWRREQTKLAYRWAHDKAKELAQQCGDAGAMVAAGRASFAAGVERLAQSDRRFAVTSEKWDADPFLLGTPGGAIDLRTGQLREARQEDYISKITACTPADKADCPLWKKFLREATNGNAGLISFIQQWAGYSLTGDTREDALVFVHGPGGNGKGVYLNTVAHVMGDYCTIAAMDTFSASNSDRHPTDLAMLKGARMVCASETEEGRAWAEARIKAMTGRDPITARFMRQDFFTFTPRFKLTIVGNHKPVLKNVDDAAKRRFNIIPFVHKPPEPDRQLEAKLSEEHPAILRWMIDGCLEWQKNGITRPQVVLDATADYFSDQDTLTQWIEDCCEKNSYCADTNGSLFASWHNYAKSRGEEPGSQRQFKPAMVRLGYVPIRDAHGIRGRGFRGVEVRVQDP